MPWSGHVLLCICFFWGTNLGGVFLQSWDKSPISLHLKQAPLLISSVLLSTVIVLTSIVFRSSQGQKLNFLAPVSFFWAGDFPAGVIWIRVQFYTCHPWCIFVAHLYEPFKVSGKLGRRMIFCCSPLESISLRQSMTAVNSVIPVFANNDLKWATCLSMFSVLPSNLSSFISAQTSSVLSKGLKTSKKMVSNTAKVLKSRGTSCFLQLSIACLTNCSFKAASPWVNNDRTNVIFLLSVL